MGVPLPVCRAYKSDQKGLCVEGGGGRWEVGEVALLLQRDWGWGKGGNGAKDSRPTDAQTNAGFHRQRTQRFAKGERNKSHRARDNRTPRQRKYRHTQRDGQVRAPGTRPSAAEKRATGRRLLPGSPRTHSRVWRPAVGAEGDGWVAESRPWRGGEGCSRNLSPLGG